MNEHLQALLARSYRTMEQLDGGTGGTGAVYEWFETGEIPSYEINRLAELLRCTREELLGECDTAPSRPLQAISIETLCEAFTVEEMQEMLSQAGVKFSKRAREKALARMIQKHQLYIGNL